MSKNKDTTCMKRKEKIQSNNYQLQNVEIGLSTYLLESSMIQLSHSDFDFDGDKEHGVSTLGYLMSIGSATITWI